MRNILFDVDGVLIHGYHAKPKLQNCWDENLENDLGINRQHFKDNYIHKDFINLVLIGKKDLNSSIAAYLESIQSPHSPQILIDYWMQNDANVNNSLLSQIGIIKRNANCNLYIATNQEHVRAQYLMDTVGFNQYFDEIFYAAEIGALKPSAEFFSYIEDRLPPSDTKPILFDDRQEIIDFANAIGWEAHQFDNVEDLKKCAYLRDVLS